MRVIHSSQKCFVLGLLVVALLLGTACSKIRYRVHAILKPPVTWTAAYRQGRSEANHDLAAGRLRYRAYGFSQEGKGPSRYAEHLRNDYNIELVAVDGCVVTDDLVNRTRGYNETALRVIEARYGKGILEQVHKQATDEWKQLHPSR